MSKKWALAIILSLPIWWVAGVAVGVNYSGPDKPHNEPHYYDEADLSIKKGDLAVQVTIAGGTILILLVTGYAVVVANRTAADALRANTEANKLAKESVDAFVDVERGRIDLRTAEIQKIAPNKYVLHVAFTNTGKGTAYIREMATDCRYASWDDTIDINSFRTPTGVTLAPIRVNDQVASKGMPGYRLDQQLFAPFPIELTDAQYATIYTTHNLVVFHYIGYDTSVDGLRQFRLTYVVTKTGFRVLTDPMLTKDVKAKGMIAPPLDYKEYVRLQRIAKEEADREAKDRPASDDTGGDKG